MYIYLGRRKDREGKVDEYEMAFKSESWDPLAGFDLGAIIPKSVIDSELKEGELIKVPVKVYFDRAVTVAVDEE